MQTQIPRISSANHERVLADALAADNRADVVGPVADVVALMPHKSLLIARLINSLSKNDLSFKSDFLDMFDEIVRTDDVHRLVSAAFVVRHLGFQDADVFGWTAGPVVEGSLFTANTLAVPSDFLERCAAEVERVRECVQDMYSEHLLWTMHILRNFRFSVQECVAQLGFSSSLAQIMAAVRLFHTQDNTLYLSVLVVELARRQSLEAILHELGTFDSAFRDTILSLLFETSYTSGEENSVYINSSYTPLKTDEETALFKSLVSDSTVVQMERISGRSKVQEFLRRDNPCSQIRPMDRDAFEAAGFEDRETFFRNFCLLGSPSISHFLAYLEIYKEHFVLSAEQQRLFLSVFFEVFEHAESFRRIVASKMVQFRIVCQELVDEACERRVQQV